MLRSPVPSRPQPIKTSPVTLPWPSAPGTGLVLQPSPKTAMSRLPNLISTGQHGSLRRQGFGSFWHKQSTPKPNAIEPTVLFRLRSPSEHEESQAKHQEEKEIPPSKAERVSVEGLSEVCEGPLDLSDGGKSKSDQSQRDYSPIALQGVERVNNSPNVDVKTNASLHAPVSSPHHVVAPSSSSTLPVKQQQEEPTTDHKHKVILGLLATKFKGKDMGMMVKKGPPRFMV